jgi:hypothetical protein
VAAALFPVALLLPFVNKAFHIDDPLSLWTAKHILEDPIRFFDYPVNWSGVEGKAYLIIKNPPLSMYYAALIGAVAGFGEPVMHAAFLLPAALVGLGTYRVASRFCAQPLFASFAAVLTPAVLISASNIMATLSMLALYVVALDLWLLGLERRRQAFFFVSALVMAASALTQYFGASLVPLVLAYTLARERKAGWWLAELSIPVVVIVAYDLLTRRLFGYGLFFEAGNYAQLSRGQEGPGTAIRMLVGTLFTGGCVWTALWFLPLLGRVAQIAACVVAVLGAVIAVVFAGQLGSQGAATTDDLSQISLSLHAAPFLAAAALLFGLAAYDLYKTRSADSLLLLLWIGGTFAFASILNWTTNGRSLLAMAPPAAILVVRALDRRGVWAGARRWAAWGLLGLMGASCLALVIADYTLANSARSAARYLMREFPTTEGRRIYLGHWGFQYYIDGGYYEHIDLRGTPVGPGDVIVLPENNMRSMELPQIYSHYFPVTFKVFPFASTFDYRVGAGFYGSTWGPLPFVIGPARDELYVAVMVDRHAVVRDPRLDPNTGLPIEP